MASRPARAATLILKSSHYQECQKRGRRLHSPHFCLFAYPSGEVSGRYGMAVSRKVGNAVSRNRVKRLLREFFRLRIAVFPGWDVVAAAKKGADALKLSDVALELEPLLAKLPPS